MYSIKQVFMRNPIQISAAVIAIVNFCIIMEWIEMTELQVSALNTALIAVLGIFVTSNTVNKDKLTELAVEVGDGGDVGGDAGGVDGGDPPPGPNDV